MRLCGFVMEMHLLKEKVMHSMTCMIFWGDVTYSMYEGLRLSFGLALPVRNTITVFDLFLVQKKKKKKHKRIHQDSLSDIFMYVTHMCMSARPHSVTWSVLWQLRHNICHCCPLLPFHTISYSCWTISRGLNWKHPEMCNLFFTAA